MASEPQEGTGATMSYSAPDLETAEQELLAKVNVPLEHFQPLNEWFAEWCTFAEGQGATVDEWAPEHNVTRGYDITFPDGHRLILARTQALQRWAATLDPPPPTSPAPVTSA